MADVQALIEKCDRYCGVDARYHRDGCALMKHNGDAALRMQAELVTLSRTDRQPPASSSQAKGGLSAEDR